MGISRPILRNTGNAIRLPERWTLEQQQYATKAEAEAALEALRRGERLTRGREDLPRHFVGKSQAELHALGSALASALRGAAEPVGRPLESPFGSHLLRLEARLPGGATAEVLWLPGCGRITSGDAREASLNRFFPNRCGDAMALTIGASLLAGSGEDSPSFASQRLLFKQGPRDSPSAP